MRVLVLALALLVPCSSAQASDWHYAGEHDVSAVPLVARLSSWGTRWLSARRWPPCATMPGGTLRAAPDLGTTDDGQPAWGRAAGCDVWVLDSVLRRARRRQWRYLWGLCDVVVHELAHTAGVSHERMDAGLRAAWRRGCTDLSDRLMN